MNWYVFCSKHQNNKELLEVLNKQEDLDAFIPKVEKWFKCSGFSDYQLMDMYPGYIFIRSLLNEEEFKSKYMKLFESVGRLGELLEHDRFISLNESDKEIMSWLFHNQGVITHSIGKYNGDDLMIMEGPLCGFESKIKKINRHKRIAKVDYALLGMNMLLPLEVINSKGSVY